MTESNQSLLIARFVVYNLPALAILVVALVYCVIRWDRKWLFIALGAAVVVANTVMGFFKAKSTTEEAGRHGVIALENAMSENIRSGFYLSLISLAGWTLIIASFVLLSYPKRGDEAGK
jgi:hypothetical protein